MKTIIRLVLIATSVIGFGEVRAVPFDAFDPVSLAMGGTGVSNASSINAVYYNPALLATSPRSEHFGVAFPVATARLADEDNFRDAATDFDDNDYVDEFSDAIDAFNAAPPANRGQFKDDVIRTARDLQNGLRDLSDKVLDGSGNTGLVVALPSRSHGISVFTNAWIVGAAFGQFTDSDEQTIDAIISDLENNNFNNIDDPTDTLTSNVRGRFAVIGEVGVGLAREFNILDQKVSLGITPKFVRVWTYDYKFVANELDDVDISVSDGERTSYGFNMDLGAAKEFGDGWKAGLVIKNIIPQSYKTTLGNEIDVDPQARVGVARRMNIVTLTADLDITENNPASFGSETRYLAMGGAVDLWQIAQLRLGYRLNTSDTDTSVFTGGLGFTAFGVHLDLAVAGASDEIAAALQTGYSF